MDNLRRDNLIELMFTSESMRRVGLTHSDPVIRAAATLLTTSPPQLTEIEKQRIWSHVRLVNVSQRLAHVEHPQLDDEGRTSIWEQVQARRALTQAEPPALTKSSKDDMLQRILAANTLMHTEPPQLTDTDKPLEIIKRRLKETKTDTLPSRYGDTKKIIQARLEQHRDATVLRKPKREEQKSTVIPLVLGMMSTAAAIVMIAFAALLIFSSQNPTNPDVAQQIEVLEVALVSDEVAGHLNSTKQLVNLVNQSIDEGSFATQEFDEAIQQLAEATTLATNGNVFSYAPQLENELAQTYVSLNGTLQRAYAEQTATYGSLDRLSDMSAALAEEHIIFAVATSPIVASALDISSEANDIQSSTEQNTEVELSAENTTEVNSTNPVSALETEDNVTVENQLGDFKDNIGYIDATARVNVREMPVTGSIIAQLDPATQVTIISVENNWVEVELSDGTIGWIAEFLVSDTPVTITITNPVDIDDTSGVNTDSTGNTDDTGLNKFGCENGNSCNAPRGNDKDNNGNRGNSNQNND